MKRWLTPLAVLTVLVIFGTGTVLAAGPGHHGAGLRYVDQNDDGICDNRGTALCDGTNCWGAFVDANGDGICDNRGTALCDGTNCWGAFVDENGDGICDNRPLQSGSGHHGGGHGCHTQRGAGA